MPKRNQRKRSKPELSSLAGYGLVLLEQSNRIHLLEKMLHQLQVGINDLVINVNKANDEVANRVQILEAKLADVEKLVTHKSKTDLKLVDLKPPLDS